MNVLLHYRQSRLFMWAKVKQQFSDSAWVCLCAGVGLFFAQPALAYESAVHQQLTFLAAKQLSRCDQTSDLKPLSALDTRYVVRANIAQADSNVFWRMFRWNYYNRDEAQSRAALGLIDTRFHDHFNGLNEQLEQTGDRQKRLKTFGRLLSYLQDVTSPSRVVPVFTSRWWRFSFFDRFDRFSVDVGRLETTLADRCAELVAFDSELQSPAARPGLQQLLEATAEETIVSVRAPIDGLPAQWTAFWQFGAPDEFGNYGPAGNKFGERTGFRCGAETCLLLEDDPLYHEFAHHRHTSAVMATMRAMLLMQRYDNEAAALMSVQ